MIKHPEGSDLLGKGGWNCERMTKSLKEVIFAL